MSLMQPCSVCHRLVFARETSCPHCQARRHPLLLPASMAAMLLVGCETVAVYGVPPTEESGETGCTETDDAQDTDGSAACLDESGSTEG